MREVKPRLKVLEVVKNRWQQKVKQTPQLRQVVLQGGACMQGENSGGWSVHCNACSSAERSDHAWDAQKPNKVSNCFQTQPNDPYP